MLGQRKNERGKGKRGKGKREKEDKKEGRAKGKERRTERRRKRRKKKEKEKEGEEGNFQAKPAWSVSSHFPAPHPPGGSSDRFHSCISSLPSHSQPPASSEHTCFFFFFFPNRKIIKIKQGQQKSRTLPVAWQGFFFLPAALSCPVLWICSSQGSSGWWG